MFSVIFEVHPKAEHWDTYLGLGKMLRSELERIEGFVDNIRYRSLTREGWILSLSGWRDEKALVRWRTQSRHHAAQDRGRTEIGNLWRLCSHHHRLKTYGGWIVIGQNGDRNLVPPDDPDPP